MNNAFWTSVLRRGSSFRTPSFNTKGYTGTHGQGGDERSLIDYTTLDSRLRREVEDVNVVRGLFSDSDHFAVVATVRMRESVPGKFYGRILNERMIKITDKSVGGEQGGLRKGKGCVDQIFEVKILVEKYLEKDRKLFAAFMDLEEAYGRVDWKGLWDILRMYGVGRKLLEGIRSFYENASASVRVNGELSESFNVEVGVRQGCVMLPWLLSIYMDGCIREMHVRLCDLGARLNVRGVEQPLVAGLYADDTVFG